MKQIYRVSRSRDPRETYFLRAMSSHEAIEIVTLRLADLTGIEAWRADPAAPAFDIPHGLVVDHEGAPIKSMEG